jgi:hypothetical protein
MTARKLKPGASRLGRFVRRWRFDRNPLRRATDRTAVLTVLVAAFLIGAPHCGLVAGAWAHGMAQRAQFTQEASQSQVTAVVLAVAASPAGGGAVVWQAQAWWRARPGGHHEVPVLTGTVVCGTLQVWTDRAGDLTTAPPLDSQVAGQATTGHVLGVIASAGALTLTGVLARRSLNKRRISAWEADWHATGPRWTTRAFRTDGGIRPHPVLLSQASEVTNCGC